MSQVDGSLVLLTRPRRAEGNAFEPLAAALQARGLKTLWLPASTIGPPTDWGSLDRGLDRLSDFDWVVATSQNAVEGLALRLGQRGVAWGERPRAAAVGRQTALALSKLGRTDVLLAPKPMASALAQSLGPLAKGRRFLWPRAEDAPLDLADELTRLGAREVVMAPAYRAEPHAVDVAPVAAAFEAGAIKAVAFASPRAIEATLAVLGSKGRGWLTRIPKVCIGPVTAEACERRGLGAPMVARESTMEGLAEAVMEALRTGE